MAYVDVTDATFQSEVVDRSKTVPVVVDLWAPWCGPCRTLGPILERVIEDTNGKVVLAKVNIDENQGIARAFQVQSIPLVVAMSDGTPVDAFLGAQGEPAVRDFVARLLPTEEESEVSQLIAAGDEESLRRALDIEPDNEDAIVGLAELMIGDGRTQDALALLAKIPETPQTARLAVLARMGGEAPAASDIEGELNELLERVKGDDEARQRYVDLLEVLGPDDPRTSKYRRALAARLY